eukprot:5307717-Prymnesium_polylepis.1
MGSGGSRMQRLASTAWVEKWFEETRATEVIDLGKIRLSEAELEPYLAGSTALHTTDVANALVK